MRTVFWVDSRQDVLGLMDSGFMLKRGTLPDHDPDLHLRHISGDWYWYRWWFPE